MANNLWQTLQNYAPTLATIFFFLFFCNVVYSVFKKGQKQKFDDYAQIPFKENTQETQTQQSQQENSFKLDIAASKLNEISKH